MEEGGPPGPGGPLTGALTAALLNGLEWSKRETAMDALVLAAVAEGEREREIAYIYIL